jgi:PhnB protein
MQLNPYLMFKGDCREAFKHYAETFHGKIIMQSTWAEAPAGSTSDPALKDQIMHTTLDLGGGALLMGSDSPPQYYKPPQGIKVTVSIDDTAEAERVFNALAKGGNIEMPLQETFWAHRFGMCTDRFGIPWMVNYRKDS